MNHCHLTLPPYNIQFLRFSLFRFIPSAKKVKSEILLSLFTSLIVQNRYLLFSTLYVKDYFFSQLWFATVQEVLQAD